MRKHFLILMLMALLPLAGFADDLSKGQMVIPSTYYGYAPNWSADNANYDDLPATDIKVYNKVNVLLKKGVDYTVDGFFADADCTQPLTPAQVKAKDATTIIYAKVTGMVAYEKSLVASFEIKKMPLTITVQPEHKTFNNKGTEDADETLGAITGISNLKQDGTDQNLSGDALTAMKNLLKVSREAGKDVKYTTGDNPQVTGYDYVVTFKTENKNYEIKSVSGSFTIEPATFPTTMGTANNTYKVTVTDNVKTYNGSAQQANVTLVDNHLGYTLTANDYTVYYDGATASALSQTNYAADGYQISFKTKGNYTTQTAVNLDIQNDPATANVDESKLNKLWINQAELDIYVDDLKKTYDGTENFSGVTFSYSGLVGNDITKEKPFGDNFEAEYASGAANSHIYEGKYLLKAKTKDGANFTSTTYANYKVNTPAFGQLTVEKRKVTITVSDSHKSYGTADPTDWTYTIQTKGGSNVPANEGALTAQHTDIANKTDKDLFAIAYTVIRNNASVEAVDTYKESLELSAKSDDDLKDVIISWAPSASPYTDVQVATMLTAIKKIFDQYTIVEKKGTFEITKAGLTVAPAKKTITYGEEYNLADFDVIARNAAGDRIDLTIKPTVKFKEAAYNEENPKDAGVYVLVVEGDIAAEGYDGTNATRNEGQFIIYKKKAQIILEDQHLMVGDYENALLTNKVRFVDNATNPSKAKDVLVDDDVIGFKLKFNIGGEAGELADANIDTQDEADEWNASTSNLANALDWTGSVPTTSGSTTTYKKFGATGAMSVNDYNSKVRPAVAVTSETDITDAHIAAAKAYNATLTGAKKPGLLAAAVSSTAYAKGVTIEPVASTKDAPNQNANYDIDWTTGSPAVNTYFGKLYVVTNTGLALNSDDNDLANIQKLGANNTTVTSAITLDLNPRNAQKLPSTTARIWDAKQWNTLVLPFDIEVADLSAAFGYAIVNVVDPNKTTTNNVAFKLEMGNIPANTPFLIKTAKKLMDATTPALGFTTNGIVTFAAASRTIKAPTEAQMEGVNAGMGYKFVPVYQTKTVDNTQSVLRFLLGNYEKWAFIEKEGSSWTLVPLTAYVDLTPAGNAAHEVTFTMEEADGSTTTVRSIEADGIDNNVSEYAKGWYTIDGMKLNAAPAQKGVYILNGKKVVVK